MHHAMKLGLGTVALLGVLALPTVADAAEPLPPAPVKDAPSGSAKAASKDKPWELGFSAASLGAFDSNIFDKGKDPTMAAGGEVNVGLGFGVPLGSRVAWASGAGLGSNARQGVNATAGDANALRVDAHLKTGIELLLFGKTSLPGRAVKKSRYPALRLALETKYAYWSNPFITQPKAATDPTLDALEPTDTSSDADLASADPASDASESGEGGEGGEEGADGGEEADGMQAEAADIPIGAQTFSNPNTHHKLTGATRLVLDVSSSLGFTAEGGGGRDTVRLTDTVQVSPEYNEMTADVSAKYKASPKYLWLTVGYGFERRIFDELNAKGLEQSFDVNGLKAVIDVPLKPMKVKLGYDLRFKSADSGPAADTTRHQVQVGTEVPVSKAFAVVADARYTNTSFAGQPDSTRFLTLAGMKAKW